MLLQTDADDGLSVDTLAQLPALRPGPDEKPVPVLRLPSTSPANASWSFERKLAAWREAFAAHGLARPE